MRCAKDKRPAGGFVALPHIVLRSEKWAMLSPLATKLMMDLLAQYNGANNGDLTTAWTVMRSSRRWKSQDSLTKARRELEERGWIQRTRQGGRHVATLWAITIFALDDDNPAVRAKLGIPTADFRRGAWAIAPPVVSINSVSCAPPAGSIAAESHRPADQSTTPERAIAPPAVSVEAVLPHSLHRNPYTFLELPSTAPDLHPPSSPSPHGPEFEKARQRAAKARARRERAAAKEQHRGR
jgi:hypothetical protein